MHVTVTGRARLRLLGSPGFVDADGCPVALPARAALLVLFILTTARDLTVPRTHLASFLWPDATHAPGNLRQLLSRLATTQNKSGIDFVRFDRATVTLNMAAGEIDLVGFQQSLVNLDWTNWEAAIEAFRGELLAGVSVAESDLSNWLDMHRAGTRDAFLKAFDALLESPGARANPRTAQIVASRILQVDPCDEAAYRAMMRSFSDLRAVDLIPITYEKCRSTIARELGTVLSPATERLFQELQAEAGPVRMSAPAAGVSPVSEVDLFRRASLPRLAVLPPPHEGRDVTVVDAASLVLEDTVSRLCSLRTMRVVGSHTSRELAAHFDDDVARRYNIGYALFSALRNRGEEALLSVRLVDIGTHDVAWADTYPLSTGTLAASHRALSSALTTALADAVERAEVARFEREEHPQAYYWYLMGQKELRYMDLPRVRRARAAFRTAITLDPTFAAAHAGNARATQRQWLVLARGGNELLDEAEQIGARAISLDHRDPRGYRELGLTHLYRRRWDDSVAHFTEAERLGPQHADLISDFGDALGHAGEPAKGLEKVERAMELNPIPPDQYWWNAAGLHFQLRDYEAALGAVSRMGDPLPALRIAAAAWAYLGNLPEAHKAAAEFLRSYPDFRIDHWLSIVPDRNADDRRHYEVGLKMAGFR
ncbi:MAG TPA: BTAD domain-containing putative transcriptional regulator [Bauldia sp.]|nr:BTAD domain-containing putative transcriptional regulator [Bauldia sp.]